MTAHHDHPQAPLPRGLPYPPEERPGGEALNLREAGAGHEGHGSHAGHSGHGGHGWMMLACCVPMVLIAVTLVATGVAGSGALVSALLCVVMMGAMMFFMPGHHSGR